MGGASLVLLQNRDDLFFSITLALHLGTSSWSTYKEIPHRAWTCLRGYGHWPTRAAGVGHSPSRGQFIASDTAEWEVRVPAGATSARIGIEAGFGIGRIAKYHYAAGP